MSLKCSQIFPLKCYMHFWILNPVMLWHLKLKSSVWLIFIYDLACCFWTLYLIYCVCMSLSSLSVCWPCRWSCLASVIYCLVSSTSYPRGKITTPQVFTFTCPFWGQGRNYLFAYHTFANYLCTSCLTRLWAFPIQCIRKQLQHASFACL